jgi:hypothetical protein
MCWTSTAVAGWRRWHDFAGEGPPGRDDDDLAVRSADGERTGVSLFQDAEDVGDRLPLARSGPTPANHDALPDIGGCEPDFEPVAHGGHLLAGLDGCAAGW